MPHGPAVSISKSPSFPIRRCMLPYLGRHAPWRTPTNAALALASGGHTLAVELHILAALGLFPCAACVPVASNSPLHSRFDYHVTMDGSHPGGASICLCLAHVDPKIRLPSITYLILLESCSNVSPCVHLGVFLYFEKPPITTLQGSIPTPIICCSIRTPFVERRPSRLCLVH